MKLTKPELIKLLQEAVSLLERDAPIGGRTDTFCKKVRKQLAAKRTKVGPLVDALKRIAAAPTYRDGFQAGEIAEDALAKVK